MAAVSPGESVAVFGAGPVGLMAAYSSLIRGAAEVYVIDHVKERLDKAESIGGIPINFDDGNPVEQIRDIRQDSGVDKGIDAVGYQAAAQGSSAAGGEQDEIPNVVLNQMIDVVKPLLSKNDSITLHPRLCSSPTGVVKIILPYSDRPFFSSEISFTRLCAILLETCSVATERIPFDHIVPIFSITGFRIFS